jgi:hypothetical protein
MPKRYLIDEPEDISWELNQERAFWERMLNQKINYFLGFFVILIIGMAVATTRELTLFVLSVGAVILWVLTVSIINTTRKINFAVKELSKVSNNPTGMVDRRAKGRLARLVLGFGLPIFCSSVITLIFAAGISGLFLFRFPSTPEVVKTTKAVIEKGKESVVEKKKPVQDNASHFENIESVIQKNKNAVVAMPMDSTFRDSSKKNISKKQIARRQFLANPNFKNVNRVVAASEIYSTGKASSSKKPVSAKTSQQKMDNPNFKNIDTLISHNEKD